MKKDLLARWLLLLITMCISSCGKDEDNGFKEHIKFYKGNLESSVYLSGNLNQCTFEDVIVEARDFSIRISATLEGKLSPSQFNYKIKFTFTEIKYLSAEMKNFTCSGYAQVYINNVQNPYTMKFKDYIGTIDASNSLRINPSFTLDNGITIDSMNFIFYGKEVQ